MWYYFRYMEKFSLTDNAAETLSPLEILQRTWKLEARLEQDQLTERERNKNVTKTIIKGLLSQGKGLAGIMSFIGMLGLAGYVESKIPDTISEAPEKKESSGIRRLSVEERNRVIEATGVDIQEIADRSNLSVEIQTTSSDGTYVLHIGQTHYIEGIEKNNSVSLQIIESQKRIESVLLSLKEHGITNVYCEGRTHENNISSECVALYRTKAELAPFGEDAVFFAGADEKLSAEGKIKILPAETDEGNDGGFIHDDELKRVKDAYFNADFKALTTEQIQQLKQEYDRVKALDDELTYTARENIAVEKIRGGIAQNTTGKLIPLVYGRAHDFSDNINRPGDTAIGLIRIVVPK